MKLILITALFLSFNVYADTRDDWRGYHMGYGAGMGPGMMGQPGMGMCPMSMMDDVKVSVTETKEGATITYTAKDKKDILRIQKMAQIMKLSQELEAEDKEKK